MIPVARVREPAGFDKACRKRGAAWLAANPSVKRPKDLWSPFRPKLRSGFGNRCGYAAMYVAVGSIDHYQSTKHRRDLAYEWKNYRFIDEWVNKSKQTIDQAVLDPYEVRDGWFEIQLPSLQLVVTSKVPAKHRARAEFTLKRLHLRDDERVIRQRDAWYQMFKDGKLTLDGLAEVAPLIAAAVREAQPTPAKKRRKKRQ